LPKPPNTFSSDEEWDEFRVRLLGEFLHRLMEIPALKNSHIFRRFLTTDTLPPKFSFFIFIDVIIKVDRRMEVWIVNLSNQC